MLNKKEELKKAVIECCVNGTMTIKQAAKRLNFSERYVKKLKARYKKMGVSSILHGNCGKQPKHTISADIKSQILTIRLKPEFEKCNTMHFQELLAELFNINISYSALTVLFKNYAIKSHRKHKKVKQHNRRKRKSSSGQLLQVDGTPHRFFYGDDKEYSLHGFIDDATGLLTGLYMCEHECMHGYLEVTRQTFQNFGIPLALYADGSSIFFPKTDHLTIEEQLAGIPSPTTQYSRIMQSIGVSIIRAGSSQAKGRIERLWNTLHDRLQTEFRIHNIITLEQANVFLKSYILKYNTKFAIHPECQVSSFMQLPQHINLDYLLSVKYFRTVDVSNCFSLNNVIFQIDSKKIFHKKKVEICISKRIGIKVFFDDVWFKVYPLCSNRKKSLKSDDSIETIIQNFIYFNCLKNERLSA